MNGQMFKLGRWYDTQEKPFLCIKDRKATGVRLSTYFSDQIIHAKCKLQTILTILYGLAYHLGHIKLKKEILFSNCIVVHTVRFIPSIGLIL